MRLPALPRSLRVALIAVVGAVVTACSAPVPPGTAQAGVRGPEPIDPRATPETRALFHNLRRLARTNVLFGHQDDLAYGYDWIAQPGRSDVRESGGAYPAVYGWEVGGLESDEARNLDGVDFQQMRGWIAEGYRRGGVITISWHIDNPVTGRDSWDTTSAVAAILPGGPKHEQFKLTLDKLATFLGSLRAAPRSGGPERPIPVIFRPWHEMTGGWFWWGLPHTKGDEFQQLWKFTVTYLRDVKGLHNLLYSYAPNSGSPNGVGPYLNGYPGDEYVDSFGYDSYFREGSGSPDRVAALTRELAWVVTQAESRGKIPAFTETGLNALPDSNFFTGQLGRAIKGDSVSRRIAYVMVWRNANRTTRNDRHFYAPYRGHPSESDFRRFNADPLFLFEDELPDLYRMPDAR